MADPFEQMVVQNFQEYERAEAAEGGALAEGAEIPHNVLGPVVNELRPGVQRLVQANGKEAVAQALRMLAEQVSQS